MVMVCHPPIGKSVILLATGWQLECFPLFVRVSADNESVAPL
jgi:hypothetical protein